jgi:hypothetical protein
MRLPADFLLLLPSRPAQVEVVQKTPEARLPGLRESRPMTSIYCETCGEWVFGARPDDDAIVILIHALAGHTLRESETDEGRMEPHGV